MERAHHEGVTKRTNLTVWRIRRAAPCGGAEPRCARHRPSNGRAARSSGAQFGEIFRGREGSLSSIAPLYHTTYNTCEYILRAHPMCTGERKGYRGPRSPNSGPAPAAPNAPRRLNPANAHSPVPLYCSPVSIDNCAQLAASRPARQSQLRRATSEGRGGGQTGVRVRVRVGRKRLECSGSARTGAPRPTNIQYARFGQAVDSADRDVRRGGLDL